MSKTTLNKANLEKLGADTLAAQVMELVQGNVGLEHRAGMIPDRAQALNDVAAGLRKQRALLEDIHSFLADLAAPAACPVAVSQPIFSWHLYWHSKICADCGLRNLCVGEPS